MSFIKFIFLTLFLAILSSCKITYDYNTRLEFQKLAQEGYTFYLNNEKFDPRYKLLDSDNIKKIEKNKKEKTIYVHQVNKKVNYIKLSSIEQADNKMLFGRRFLEFKVVSCLEEIKEKLEIEESFIIELKSFAKKKLVFKYDTIHNVVYIFFPRNGHF